MKRVLFILLLLAVIASALLLRQRPAAQEHGKVTLRFAFWGSDTEIASMRAISDAFEAKYPNIRVKAEPLPWGQYWLKMKTQAAGSEDGVPDILRMTSIYGAEWAARGLLADISPLVARDGLDMAGYYRASMDAVTFDGRLRSMPTDAAVRVYFYSKDLFDAAGVPYLDPVTPLTWDELRAIAHKLTIRRDDRVVQYGFSLGYMEYDAFIAQAGGRLVDRPVDPTRVTVNTPEGIRGLQFYSDLIVKDKVSPPEGQHEGLGFGAPDFALQSGKVAIQHGGPWSIPGLAKAVVNGRPLRYGLAPIARDRERSQIAFTNSCAIASTSRHAEEAWLFLKFFASEEGQRLVAQRGVGIPVMKSVARSDAFLVNPDGAEHMEVFLDELEVAETNVMPASGEFRDALKKIVAEQLCLGSIDAAEAARRMEVVGNRLLAGRHPPMTAATRVIAPAALVVLVLAMMALLIRRARRQGRDVVTRPPSRSENRAGYLFIAPWLAGLVLFALGPILLALGTSFTDWNLFDSPHYVGAANYARAVADDPDFVQSVKVTLLYAATAIPIQMAGGLLCALLLNMRGLRGKGVFRTVLYLPYLFTGVAISIVWRYMYVDNGLVNAALQLIGIKGPNWLMSESWALPAIVLMNFTWLGGNMIIFLAALQGVPQSLYDAAQVDGAGPLRRFRHVTLPMISPAVLFNLIMGTIWSFQVFAVPRIMTDGGPNDATLFYVLNLYRRAFQYNEMGYACALAVFLFVIIFVVTLIELRGSKRWVYYEGAK